QQQRHGRTFRGAPVVCSQIPVFLATGEVRRPNRRGRLRRRRDGGRVGRPVLAGAVGGRNVATGLLRALAVGFALLGLSLRVRGCLLELAGLGPIGAPELII